MASPSEEAQRFYSNYSDVVKIYSFIDGQEFEASGTLIAPDEVLTASHVVYNADNQYYATNIFVIPGENGGSAPFGTYEVQDYHYFRVGSPGGYITGSDIESDYAVLHLSLNTTLPYMGLQANFGGGGANVTGYPSDGPQATLNDNVSIVPGYSLLQGGSLGPGSSGGPVWVQTATGQSVVGVVSAYGYDNFGNQIGYNCQITTAVENQIQTWMSEDHQPTVMGLQDFNGDNNSDILWQNTNGTPAIWEMNDINVIGGGWLPNPGPAWHAIGSGDFYGLGQSDILWQNSDGTPAIWEMSDTVVIGGGWLPNPGAAWHVVGSGDFNADGKSDILWQNSDGTPAIWEMNGTSVIGGGWLPNPGASWHVVGTGDFNGDGKSDILWQNSDGTPAIWELDGVAVIDGRTLPNPGPSWHIVGSGDFNGDGRSDILWQNSDGTPAIWEMSGNDVIGGGPLPNPGLAWHVIGTGDFNGDGRADILFQNSDGTPAIWEMAGTNVIGGGWLSNPGTNWNVVTPAHHF